MNEMSLIAPVAYAILAAANPAALSYTPLHAASLLLAASLSCYLRFCADKPSPDLLGGTFIALGAAGLFHPPLFWLTPVYAATTVSRAESKGRFWVTALLALVFPAAVHIGIQYLRGGYAPPVILHGFLERMTAISHPVLHLSAATLVRILLTFVVAAAASLHLLRRLSRFRTGPFHATVRTLLITLVLTVLSALFLTDGDQPAGLLVMFPVSLILNAYLRNAGQDRSVRMLGLILLLVLAVERVSLLL